MYAGKELPIYDDYQPLRSDCAWGRVVENGMGQLEEDLEQEACR
jgi:hypothetical protein